MASILLKGTLVRFIHREDDDGWPDSITLGKVYPVYQDMDDNGLKLVALPTDDGTTYNYYDLRQVEVVIVPEVANGFDTP